MKGEKLLVTKKDIKRFKVLKDVIEKKLKGTQAAQLLGLSVVHVSRLKKGYLLLGSRDCFRNPRLHQAIRLLSVMLKRSCAYVKSSTTISISCILWTNFEKITSSCIVTNRYGKY